MQCMYSFFLQKLCAGELESLSLRLYPRTDLTVYASRNKRPNDNRVLTSRLTDESNYFRFLNVISVTMTESFLQIDIFLHLNHVS